MHTKANILQFNAVLYDDTILEVHRYSKYLLIYSVPLQDYDTFQVILRVILSHHIIEELVQLSYFYKEFPRNYSLEI